MLSANSASAQTSPYEGRRVADVQFQPPDVPLAPQDLNRLQRVKKGGVFHLADVGTALDQLFASGVFEDIQVDVETSEDDAVIVRFITVQTTFIGHVGVNGKTPPPPNRGQLVNVALLNLGTPYHDSDLPEARTRLQNLLQSNGFYEATVQPATTRDEHSHSTNFVFQVHTGKRAKYTFPVIQGNPILSDATILRVTGWRVPLIHWWRQVTQAKTRNGLDAIERKYQKQDRLTSQVTLNELKYQPAKRRLQPNLTLNAGPKVEVKAVEAKVSKGRLRKYVPVYQEGATDRDLLVEGARNLRDYFQSQGYYDAGVDFRSSQPKPDQMLIEYVIAKGPRYKLVNVSVRGNKYFDTPTLRERMFLEPASFQLRHGRYSDEFRKKDEETIANLYRANGFRDVKVTSEVINPYKGKQGEIGVTMVVDEGPQWFVSDLKIEGATRFKTSALESKLTSLPGQPFAEVNVATDRNFILTDYFTAGFPAATFEYKVVNTAQPNHVNLIYTVHEGRQQFVQDIVITGLTITRRRLVDKQITFNNGDPLAPVRVTGAQRRLYQLGIFAKVDAAVQNQNGDTDYKRVLYDFEEADRYVVNLGFGAEIAQFGPTASNYLGSPGGATGFSPRGSIDVSRLNMLGLGHTATFRALVSDLEQRVSLEYLLPRFQSVEGRNITFSLLYDNARDVRTFSSRREEGSVQISQRFSKSVTGMMRFSYRRVSVTNVVIPTLLVPQLAQPVRIGIIAGNIIQDRRDDPADAHRGIYNTIDIGEATHYFGSQRDFLRVLGRNATYTPIGKKLVFARQTQVGIIFPYNPPRGISAAQSVPLPERFFGGGPNSDRAFAFNQAGPRDIGTPASADAAATEPTGFPLGGNALFFNNLELRFPLIGANIGGVIFHDAGNVYSTLSNISFRSTQRNLQDFNYMVHAVGFGIRYKTPVGPLRLDLAYAINPPSFVGFKGTIYELLSCNPNAPPTGVCVGVPQNLGHFQFSFAIGQAF